MKFPRILIKAPNWIGDAVLSGPFLRSLRTHWRKAHISVLARAKVRAVMERVAQIDELAEEDGRGIISLAGWMRREAFDVLVTLSSNFAVPAAGAAARIPLRTGFRGGGRGFLLTHAIAPLPRSLHQVEHYLALGTLLGVSRPSRSRLLWRVKTADRMEASAFLRSGDGYGKGSLVALAPGGAYGPAKRWFTDRWAALADRLSLEFGSRVVIVGGREEAGYAEAISELAARQPITATGHLSLAGTAALLARCRAFVSNDSGLLHVGSAVGVPTIGLFGSSNPNWTGPCGGAGRALWGHVPCAPCYRRRCLPGRNYACLEALSVDLVWGQLRPILRVARGKKAA